MICAHRLLELLQLVLDEEGKVRVLALGGGPLALLDVVFGNIDTLREPSIEFKNGRDERVARRAHHLGCLPECVFRTVDKSREA